MCCWAMGACGSSKTASAERRGGLWGPSPAMRPLAPTLSEARVNTAYVVTGTLRTVASFSDFSHKPIACNRARPSRAARPAPRARAASAARRSPAQSLAGLSRWPRLESGRAVHYSLARWVACRCRLIGTHGQWMRSISVRRVTFLSGAWVAMEQKTGAWTSRHSFRDVLDLIDAR